VTDNAIGSEILRSEKLGLTKDLSSLQLEVERLKNQNSSYQNVLAEKLAFERQLSSLEVQLESERHAFERARANDSREKEEEAKIRARLENEIYQVRSEGQRSERESHKKMVEWENQKIVLEDRLESLTKKLRSTKELLEEAQDKLRQQNPVAANDKVGRAGQRVRGISNNRTTSQFDPNMTIATPGAVHASDGTKRSSFPGDKSTFSITPFLGRTSNISDLSPGSTDHSEQHATKENYESHSALDADVDPGPDKKTKAKYQRHNRKAATMASSRESEGQKPELRPERTKKTLSNKESRDLSEQLDEIQSVDPDGSMNDLSIHEGPKLKKRKLLGSLRDRTLFDDEDGKPGGNKPERRRLGTGRKLPDIKHPIRNRKFDESAQFSPLKRERKSLR
jgi:hypothetical protein